MNFNESLLKSVLDNDIDNVKNLLKQKADPNSQDKKGNTPLILACENKNMKIVELLIENKADPNLQNRDKTNPIFIASLKRQLEMIKILVKNGATFMNQDIANTIKAIKENDTEKALSQLENFHLNFCDHGIIYETAIRENNMKVIEYFEDNLC